MAGQYKSKGKRKSGAAKPTKKDMFMDATLNMIEVMKKGSPPWSKGRVDAPGSALPANFNTGKRYRGINLINLMCVSQLQDLTSNYFITYNQALAVNGLSRKDPELIEKSPLTGQKSVASVVYWGNTTKDKNGKPWFVIENGKKRTTPTKEEIKKHQLQQIWFLRSSAVFAFEQMSHVPEPWLEKRNMTVKSINKDFAGDASAEMNEELAKLERLSKRIEKALGVTVTHSAHTRTPSYTPAKDEIVMPPIEMYENSRRYYHSLFHEMIHSTGHHSRLDRESLRDYGSAKDIRAYEELIAELGGVFLGIELDIRLPTSSELENHASYIESWISNLSDDVSNGDCTMLNKACSDAEKAVGYIMEAMTLELENTITQKSDKPETKAPEPEPEPSFP